MEKILSTTLLRKEYGQLIALNDLTLSVEKGQIFGLLGPNGSGKTTTLGILLGVLRATKGSFNWFDNGSHDGNRKNIGALLETPNFYPYLNAVDNLKVVGKIKDVDDISSAIERVLKRVNLWERRNDKFKTYSLGMKQRLAIAAALLKNPEVLVLDEPTNGLDPQGIAEIRSLISEIAEEGKTIIIASHLLDEIEKVCSHVAILKNGKLLKVGTLEEIMTQDRVLHLVYTDVNQLKKVIENIAGITYLADDANGIKVVVDEKYTPSDVNKLLAEEGIYLSGLSEYKKNLETMFLEIIN